MKTGAPRITWIRRLGQLAVVGAVVWLALGQGKRAFEAFCPFGGIEAAWGLFREQAYTCTTSEMNVAMLLAVLALALAAGKAFCGWLCPIGFLNEMLYPLGQKIHLLRRIQVPLRADRALRLLRYPFTLLMVVLTWRAGELLLRGYDPFYILFSGFGHGTLGLVSGIAIGVTLFGALVVPMFWCRYLCPLGAVQDLLTRFGLVRVHRDAGACTGCGACDKVCLQRLEVSAPPSVASIDCTRCLDCLEACPEKALSVRLGPPLPRARRGRAAAFSGWLVPVPVAASLLFGFRISEPLTLPTAERVFRDVAGLEAPATVTCTVEGVKCRGTALLFLGRVATLPGVAEAKTYAGLHRVVMRIDRNRITPEALRDSIDAPVPHPQTGVRYPDIFRVTEFRVD